MDALGQNGILLASQTGSGKTLAYLLPIVHQLKQWENFQGRGKPKRPRCIVVASLWTPEVTDVLQAARPQAAICKSQPRRNKNPQNQ